MLLLQVIAFQETGKTSAALSHTQTPNPCQQAAPWCRVARHSTTLARVEAASVHPHSSASVMAALVMLYAVDLPSLKRETLKSVKFSEVF